MPINHLQNSDAQRRALAAACGLHVVKGHLIRSYSTGTSPNHTVYFYQALGEGRWNQLVGVWYDGIALSSSNYHWHPGKISTGPSDPDQGTDSWFPLEVPHSSTATIAVQLPVGVASADTKQNPPDKLSIIAETMLFPDFDSGGSQVGGLSYTTNPARCLLGKMLLFAQLSTQPSTFDEQFAQHWLSRINWAKWVAWRDFLDGLETVDYSLLDEQGSGVGVSYFNGTSFDTFVTQRIEAVINVFVTGSPAPGVNATNYSARFEGKIRAKYTETYTFTLIHDDGAKLWVNDTLIIDQWGTTGTHTNTIALTAGQLYNIKVEMFNGSGAAQCSVQWDSTSQTLELVPQEVLYPVEQRKRYESHLAFSTPSSLEEVIAAFLTVSNSVMQDVDGKLEFYCLEQLTNTFDFVENVNIKHDTFTLLPPELRRAEIPNRWEIKFRDIQSQYLEQPTVPVALDFPDLQALAGKTILQIIDFTQSGLTANMSRWQARKVLTVLANRVINNKRCEFEGTALTFPVVAGDRVRITHANAGWTNKNMLVIEATDLADDAESRRFILQEWS